MFGALDVGVADELDGFALDEEDNDEEGGLTGTEAAGAGAACSGVSAGGALSSLDKNMNGEEEQEENPEFLLTVRSAAAPIAFDCAH